MVQQLEDLSLIRQCRQDGKVSFGYSTLRGKRANMEDFLQAKVRLCPQLYTYLHLCVTSLDVALFMREWPSFGAGTTSTTAKLRTLSVTISMW